jgi:hypothetical protein
MGVKLSLSHQGKDKIKVSENRVLRIFGPKVERGREAGEDCMTRSFITCTINKYY